MMDEFGCISPPVPHQPPAPTAPDKFQLLMCSGFKASLRTRRGGFTFPFPTLWKISVQAYKSHFHFQKQSW